MAYQLLIFVMNLNCTYINLDSAKERKKRFEKQIRHLPFTFNRDSAKTVDDVRKENLNGKLHDRGKAIFLSHLEAINTIKQDNKISGNAVNIQLTKIFINTTCSIENLLT